MNRASSATGWVRNPDGTLGWTWNPITGCLNGCEYCYARRLANGRLKQRYLANRNVAPRKLITRVLPRYDPFYPRFWEDRLGLPIEHPTPMRPAKRKGIFVCDMSDLFGIGIPHEWTEQVMTTIKLCPYHRFYLLTKQPQNLVKFLGGNITNTHKGYKKPKPLPENVWAGVTVTTKRQAYGARDFLQEVPATVKFLSLEPLLEHMDAWALGNVIRLADQVIIGACTGTMVEMAWLGGKYPDLAMMPYGKRWTLQPRIEHVEEIVRAADKAGTKVFLKENLKPLLLHQGLQKNIFWRDLSDERGFEPLHTELRQELPT